VLAQDPLFHQIKQKYNWHYKIAQKLYKIFCEEFDIPYSNEEASWVAIYLYKNTINEEEKTYKAYLICGTGRGFSKLLEQRLANIFPNIVVLETLSSFYLLKKQNLNEADIIISTIELPDLPVPVVKVSSFLGRRDIQLINQILEYGTTVESLSFSTGDFEIGYKIGDGEKEDTSLNQEHANIFANIFLELYNVLVNLPEEYEINQDKLLGMTIHMIIALPRYFASEEIEQDEELVKEVIDIETQHKTLSREMNLFLNSVESKIGVGIPYTERYALYQYILN
jgi:transcriptional regulatory protein LevR